MANLPQPRSSQGPGSLETETSNQMFKTKPGVQGFSWRLETGEPGQAWKLHGRKGQQCLGRGWNMSLPPQSRVGSGAWGCGRWVSHNLRGHSGALGEAA